MEIIEPLDRESELHRYMDLAKFLHILESEKLFLSRVSKFEDKLEGGVTPTFALLKNGMAETLDHVINNVWPSSTTLTEQEIIEKERKEEIFNESMENRTIDTVFGEIKASDCELATLYEQHREWVDVSCWHSNDSESMAMWKIYGGSTNSVCIVTNVQKLIRAVKKPSSKELMLAEVSYIDHTTDNFKLDHPLSPLLHKSKFYSFENEVRLIAYDPNTEVLTHRDEDENGTLVEVNLQDLLTEIRVAHDSPPWFLELVNSIVRDKYGLKVKVAKSKMTRLAIFDF